MDVLVYNKIKDPALKQGILDALSTIADPTFSTPDLLLLNNKILEDVVKHLQGFLHQKELSNEDIIYIFYTKSTGFGMWPLKREGRKRITKISAL